MLNEARIIYQTKIRAWKKASRRRHLAVIKSNEGS